MKLRRNELARAMSVSPTTISTWKTRYPDFPRPIGRYYDLDQVIKWYRSKEWYAIKKPYTA